VTVTARAEEFPGEEDAPARQTHEQLHGTLWIQTALEHDVCCVQTYALATIRVSQALKNTSWTAALDQPRGYEQLPPAVILDVDETVLDNSIFQARLVDRKSDYSDDLWAKWVAEKKSSAMPGVKDFLQFLAHKGVLVFFVTNREFDCEASTVDNLSSVLGQQITRAQVLCRNENPGWGSDKSSRRLFLAESHRIILLVGDDFNDFAYLGMVSPQQRFTSGSQYREYWGTKWIQLPNPNYGHWEKAIYDYDYSVTDVQKLRLKHDALDTKGEPPRTVE